MAKNYIRLFKKYWGYGDQHIPNCWSCYGIANDIHHIEGRKMGGNNKKNSIDNLIPLCRSCHTRTDYDKEFNNNLKTILKGRINDYENNKNIIW